MRSHQSVHWLVPLVIAALLTSTTPGLAETSSKLNEEAFLRGGEAIREALRATAVGSSAITIPAYAPPEFPAQARATSQDAGSGRSAMRKLGWAALIGGFVVGGILIYHYAKGPGASIRNCSTCN